MAAIRLKELVQEIRRQLEELDNDRTKEGKAALFELQSLELELKFAVEENTAETGGFDFKIVALGSEQQYRSETIQAIKIIYYPSDSYNGAGRRAHSSSSKSVGTREGIKPLE